jgi:hypothetical protein
MAEVNDVGAGGRGYVRADILDALAFNQDGVAGEYTSGPNVDEAAGFDEDWSFFGRRGMKQGRDQ